MKSSTDSMFVTSLTLHARYSIDSVGQIGAVNMKVIWQSRWLFFWWIHQLALFLINESIDSLFDKFINWLYFRYPQGGEDPQDALSCRSFFAKETPIIGLFCRKWPMKIRHPMDLSHPVIDFAYALFEWLCRTNMSSKHESDLAESVG